jgi:predicted O-methyltransferase YrrM
MVEQDVGYGPPTPTLIFQWAEEFEQCLELYRRQAPLCVLEIGTYYGGTLYHWLQNAEPGSLIVTVDSYATGIDNRHLYAEWTPPDVRLVVIDADSGLLETARQVAQFGPFDWIFIDGGHYYGEVRRDWTLYGPMRAPGGLVLFHDILPPSPQHPEIEVSYLWRELRQTHVTQEIVADRQASWGGIGVVGPPLAAAS